MGKKQYINLVGGSSTITKPKKRKLRAKTSGGRRKKCTPTVKTRGRARR